MAKTNAERQREWRARQPKKSQGKCPICGGLMWGPYAIKIGFHQQCDNARYMQRYRQIKKAEQESKVPEPQEQERD